MRARFILLPVLFVCLTLLVLPSRIHSLASLESSQATKQGISSEGRWQCWKCDFSVYGVAMNSSSDGWAVGQNGNILHYDGHSWNPYTVSFSEELSAIDMVSASDGWAVGGSSILRWDGNIWSEATSPASSLKAIDMISESDGWAVGEYGSIIHWDGMNWDKVDNDPAWKLYAVDMISESDGWAVGSIGLIQRWNGQSWERVTSPTSERLLGVKMVSATDGWAVGWDGSILHWNGLNWSFAGGAGVSLNAIDMISASNGWSVGEAGTIMHFDGGEWSIISSPTTSNLYALHMISESDGWAFGASGISLHWNGNRWTVVSEPVGRDLFAIDMVSATDGWIVGRGGIIKHWDGNDWTDVSSPTDRNLYSVDMVSGNEGWAVGHMCCGDTIILHWDGAYWRKINAPVYADLRSISMVSSDDGWAVGTSGSIVHWDGTEWQRVSSPNSQDLYSIDMISTNDGWATGWYTILHWDGIQWSEIAQPYRAVRSVDMVSENAGWAVGEIDLLHWDGTSWSDVYRTYSLRSINMVSATDGWAVGGDIFPPSGRIVRWDGIEWSIFDDPIDRRFSAVAMISRSDGWIVGDNGTIWRYRETDQDSVVMGRITDSDGNGLPGVAVWAGFPRGTTTSAAGYYSLEGLSPGAYTITPVKSGYSFSPEWREISVPPNAVNQNFTGVGGPPRWTLMFYNGPDNDANQEARLWTQYQELALASNNPNVNLVGFWDARNGPASYDIFSNGGRIIALQLPEVSTGSPETLADFIHWATENYPAEHFALIISDHGHGLIGTARDFHPGILHDDLTIPELEEAIAVGPPLDIIYMDACLMATIEAGYQIRNYVDYYVASESPTWNSIHPSWFISGVGSGNNIIPRIELTTQPRELAIAMAQAYERAHNNSTTPSTISVANLSLAELVANSASTLAGVLRVSPSFLDTIRYVGDVVQRYDENDDDEITTNDVVADLNHFALLIENFTQDENIREAADALQESIASFVIYNEAWDGRYRGNEWSHFHSYGVSVYLPPPLACHVFYSTDWLDFASGTTCLLAPPGLQDYSMEENFEWGPMVVDYIYGINPEAPMDFTVPDLVAPHILHSIFQPIVKK